LLHYALNLSVSFSITCLKSLVIYDLTYSLSQLTIRELVIEVLKVVDSCASEAVMTPCYG